MKPILFFLFVTFSISIYSQVEFEDHIITDNSNSLDRPKHAHSSDLDGDGDLDVLAVSSNDNTIVWYENIDGQGSFGDQRVIYSDAEGANGVHSADLDGDGDLDVISSSSGDDRIIWYENTDGQGNFSFQEVIDGNAHGTRAVYAADLDNDGDIDVLAVAPNDNKIAWYENTNGQGNFSSGQTIDSGSSLLFPTSVYAIDIDNDGDIDILSASFQDNKIAWYENTNGQGSFGDQQIITTSAQGAEMVYAKDVDGDGDIDVLSASSSDDKIAWYENTNGQGIFSNQQIISATADKTESVYAEDVDGDGDIDVLSVSFNDNKVVWYENTNGQGSFSTEQIISLDANGAVHVSATDIDGDGDSDVLSVSNKDNKLSWYENIDGQGTFGNQISISKNTVDAPVSVKLDDIDGDGDLDVICASSRDQKISWYENVDGLGNFSIQKIITTNADVATSVYTGDVDSDGDIDVVSSSSVSSQSGNDKIAWYENVDGQGNFGEQQIISLDANGASSVFVADMDNDMDLDVVSSSIWDDKIAWYENTNGQGDFSNEQIVSTNADRACCVHGADFDGDGDMDIVSASKNDDKIAWYENTNGQGSFSAEKIVSTNASEPSSVFPIDIDSDGDIDILAVFSLSNDVVWYENLDGLGNFGIENIVSGDAISSRSVHAADFDLDGDVDILSTSLGITGDVSWHENIDGNGTFGPIQIITTTSDGTRSVFSGDIDGDGDQDVLAASNSDDKITWYENLSLISNEISETNYSSLDFSVYPIPVKEVLYIESDFIIERIEVYNQLGQLILVNSKESIINVSDIRKGTFYCKIIDVNGTFGIKKMIKL